MATDIWRPPLTAKFALGDIEVEAAPLGPAHRLALAEGFEALSEKSRFLRFMSPMPRLTDSELSYLTDMDMVDRFAWGLLVDGEPAAVGRYARIPEDEKAVEVALTVVDGLHGRGLGTFLVRALAVVARDAGFETLVFELLAENGPMVAILERLGADMAHADGTITARVPISAVPEPVVAPSELLEVVRAARGAGPDPG